MPLKNPPDWWEFELELSPHVLDRMIDRGFTETDLRLMIEVTDDIRPGSSAERWILGTMFQRQRWEVVGAALPLGPTWLRTTTQKVVYPAQSLP